MEQGARVESAEQGAKADLAELKLALKAWVSLNAMCTMTGNTGGASVMDEDIHEGWRL